LAGDSKQLLSFEVPFFVHPFYQNIKRFLCRNVDVILELMPE
jgi:hypothetical protein